MYAQLGLTVRSIDDPMYNYVLFLEDAVGCGSYGTWTHHEIEILDGADKRLRFAWVATPAAVDEPAGFAVDNFCVTNGQRTL